MPCYSPLEGYRGEGGKLTLAHRPDLPVMTVPCGGCIGCRLDRARDWAIRCTHEAQMHEQNSFITLTYSPANLPHGGNLHLPDFQQFLKDIRNSGRKVRYFHCGEYGEKLHRPHYHAILFGLDFPDKKLLRLENNHPLYSSKELSKLWPHGHSSIGTVTFQSAGYVARYVTKKVTGDAADDHYWTQPDPQGEIHKLKPEYTTMSNRPGIGRAWFQKYWRDLYPHDSVRIKTEKGERKYPIPRYYDKQLQKMDPDLYDHLKFLRTKRALEKGPDTYERLAQREFVKRQQFKKLPRTLETL